MGEGGGAGTEPGFVRSILTLSLTPPGRREEVTPHKTGDDPSLPWFSPNCLVALSGEQNNQKMRSSPKYWSSPSRLDGYDREYLRILCILYEVYLGLL